ncbi:MAG: transposase [Dysgonomonas sp.]|nr:transposase [Dysgonomonas sp.]
MNRPLPNRRSIRLQGYDYSGEGLYFVTICAQDMKCLFGKVVNNNSIKTGENVGAGFYSAQDNHHPFIQLSEIGKIIHKEWLELKIRFVDIELYEFVIMPNHFHGIIEVRVEQSPTLTLGDIICAFKSLTTKKVNQINNTPGDKLWQRNYYEHIIRNSTSYMNIAKYIQSNPANWATDDYYSPTDNCLQTTTN